MQSTKSQTELIGFEKRITLPGCCIHRNGLIIDDDVTDEQLSQIKGTLHTINESGLWWWGDYLNFTEFKRGISYEAAAGDSDYAPESLRKARRISAAFEFGTRVPLSWHHHHDALNECEGNAVKALDWLKKAAESGWSISEMRKQIRLSAPHAGEKDKGQFNPMQFVLRITTWFKQKPTAQQAAALLPELERATDECRKLAGVAQG